MFLKMVFSFGDLSKVLVHHFGGQLRAQSHNNFNLICLQHLYITFSFTGYVLKFNKTYTFAYVLT